MVKSQRFCVAFVTFFFLNLRNLGSAHSALAAEPSPTSPVVPSAAEPLRPYGGALDEALLAVASGHYKDACPALRKIFQDNRAPDVLFQMAECYEKWGKTATAHAAYEDYIAMVDQWIEEKRIEEATERERYRTAITRYNALEKRVPRVTLYLPMHAPVHTAVTYRSEDGGRASKIPLERAIPIDPGKHWVQTRVPTGRPHVQELVIGEGERKAFVLGIDVRPEVGIDIPPIQKPIEAYIPQLRRRTSAQRVAAYSLMGVGIAGLATGGITGLLASQEQSAIDRDCPAKKCSNEGNAAIASAEKLGTAAKIALPLGLVALGTGVTLYLTEPNESPFSASTRRWSVGVGVFPGQTTVEMRASW